MKKLSAIILIVLLALSFAGCEKEPVTYTSADGNYEITTPGEWDNVEGKLNSNAVFEFANFDTATYVAIIPYPAELFPTAADFAVNIVESVPKWYGTADIKEPVAYKYDDTTYYKIYAFQQGEDALAIKFNMVYDELNYFLAISYTDNTEDYQEKLDSTESIIHSLKLLNPPVQDPALDGVGEPPADIQADQE